MIINNQTSSSSEQLTPGRRHTSMPPTKDIEISLDLLL
eukprot:COSAG06_NODE_2543_length_6702_cov_2.532031_3_plen_38_part_00